MSLIVTYDVSPGIRHSLYLGGKDDARDGDKLYHRWRITHILNVTPPKEANIDAGVPNYFESKNKNKQMKEMKEKTSTSSSKTATSPSFAYLRIPIYDSPTSVPQLDDHKDRIVNFVAKGLCHGNVLIHCHHGISRSTTCLILYLMG
jgi:protein-tyrosine phosphatase